MRKALGRAVLVAAVSSIFLVPMAGGAQAAPAASAGEGTTVSQAHPCDWHPWHPRCRYSQDVDLIGVDLL
jgi:hypothetical protein